jgi:hypothetical protein
LYVLHVVCHVMSAARLHALPHAPLVREPPPSGRQVKRVLTELAELSLAPVAHPAASAKTAGAARRAGSGAAEPPARKASSSSLASPGSAKRPSVEMDPYEVRVRPQWAARRTACRGCQDARSRYSLNPNVQVRLDGGPTDPRAQCR